MTTEDTSLEEFRREMNETISRFPASMANTIVAGACRWIAEEDGFEGERTAQKLEIVLEIVEKQFGTESPLAYFVRGRLAEARGQLRLSGIE